jgi:tetratricopeptide (TPR) repeat protein
MLNYHIFGLNPWGFHFVTILFHAGVSVLVFHLIARLLKEQALRGYFFPTFVALALFATHPIHTEAVAWVGGFPDPSCTFLFLLSLSLYILATDKGILSKTLYLFSVVSFFLAALCKETALTLPVILVAYDYAFRKSQLLARPWRYFQRYLPFLAAAAVYFGMRIHALERFAPFKKHTFLHFYQYVINGCSLFVSYLQKLLLPINLSAFYLFRPITSVFQAKALISIGLILVFILFVWVASRKNNLVFFGLLLITVPLLPALYIPALGESVFSERYLYLPSVGFVILIAALLFWLQQKKPACFVPSAVICLFLVILYSIGTVQRNTVWKDNYSLWTDTVKKSPDAPLPHSELGIAYIQKDLIDEGIDHIRTAIRLKPSHAAYYNNLGLAYAKKGWIEEAMGQFKIALRLNPNDTDARYNLGRAYDSKGLINMAIENYQIVLGIKPRHEKAHTSLGIAYGRKGMPDRAIEHFLAVLELKPDDPQTHHNLAIAYMMAGLKHKAEEHKRKAIQVQRR